MMGIAKQRGTFEERRAQSLARQEEQQRIAQVEVDAQRISTARRRALRGPIVLQTLAQRGLIAPR